jgi:hypothetical protein
MAITIIEPSYDNRVNYLNHGYYVLKREGEDSYRRLNCRSKNIPGIESSTTWNVYGDDPKQQTGFQYVGMADNQPINLDFTLDLDYYALFMELRSGAEEFILFCVLPELGKALKYPVCEVNSVETGDVESNGAEATMTVAIIQRGGLEANQPQEGTWTDANGFTAS